MTRTLILAAAALLVQAAAINGPAPAQTRLRTPPAQPAPPPEYVPPYEAQILRLAEVMGALTVLRELCGNADGKLWRGRMAELMESEAVTPGRRERFAGAFNLGFSDYQQSYARCTDSARIAIDRLLDEGGRITREINSRYGG